MPSFDIQQVLVVQPLENDAHLVEGLFFPEVSCVGDDLAQLQDMLAKHIQRLMESLEPGELHRRFPSSPPELATISILLEPGEHGPAWRHPVELILPYVRWVHPGLQGQTNLPVDPPPPPEAVVAYFPTLGIEVLARRPEDLDPMLKTHLRAALLRAQANTSLERLVWLQRCQSLQLMSQSRTVNILSPKQRAQQEAEDRARAQSVLAEVGMDLTAQAGPPVFALEEVVQQLADHLTGRLPRSVLLIGPNGVGKTAAVRELVRKRERFGLGSTPFWATSGVRLVAGMSGFGMWQQRCGQLWREAASQRAILHLGNLMELVEVGKGEHQPQGVASFLRPFLARGDLLALAECTPEQVLLIERRDPSLLNAFVRLLMKEPAPDRSRQILERVALANRTQGELPIEPAALDKLDRLHRRYATYSAYPGRPLRFLHGLLADQPRKGTLTAQDVTKSFSRETGLPLFLVDEKEPLDLEQARQWFTDRVLGQSEAVDLVVDLLATIKTELGRPRKPLASLLFIGPTGVGKTEMAKALAEFLFGSAQRLLRFDMSEYADPLAVQRLVGGSFSAEGLLTARVREQPFAVILLDEVEKADPQLFDLLLQVLGDGRLTDAHGRLADFCNCVIVMTSNLGATSYQQGGFGFLPGPDTRGHAQAHFIQAVEACVRPELFNRIDRIVPFAPLDADTILGVSERQLDLLRRRDGIHYRGIALEIAPGVSEFLGRKGFDPRYGARPLKRAIERDLLAPLAENLNRYSSNTPLRAAVEVNEGLLLVNVRSRGQEADRGFSDGASQSSEAFLVTKCLEVRREMQRLQSSAAGLELENEISRLQHLEGSRRPGKWTSPDEALDREQLKTWCRLRDEFLTLLGRTYALEDEGLLRLYGQRVVDWEQWQADLERAHLDWNRHLRELFLVREGPGNEVTLAVFSEQTQWLLDLTGAYYHLGLGQGWQVQLWQFVPRPAAGPGKKTSLARRVVSDSEKFLNPAGKIWVRPWDERKKQLEKAELVQPLEGVVGAALEIRGSAVNWRLTGETGLHILQGKNSGKCLVEAGACSMKEFVPPEGVERRGAIGSQPKRRIYQLERGEVEDLMLRRKFRIRTAELHLLLAEITDQLLQDRIRDMLNS